MAAAQLEVWTGTDLRRLLAERAGLELSSASVSALFTKGVGGSPILTTARQPKLTSFPETLA
jgi:hypothetical protein